MIKDYLINNDGGSILSEFDKTGALCDLTRKRLITQIAHFMVETFGSRPNKTQKKMASMATIELFPFLKALDSKLDGIVRVCAAIYFIYQMSSGLTYFFCRICCAIPKVGTSITN